MHISQEFQNKSILITGGSRGIGKRLAIGFARLGARLALMARSRAELDLTHIEIEQNGGNALRIRGDVTDPEQMAVAVDRARVAYGGAAGHPDLRSGATRSATRLFANLRKTLDRAATGQLAGSGACLPRRAARHGGTPQR